MNDNDLRDCFALMLTVGFAVKGEINPKAIWDIADEIIEARNKPKENDDDEEDVGIARVAPKRNYRRKS
jgi:hypothetical protein